MREFRQLAEAVRLTEAVREFGPHLLFLSRQ